MISPPETGLVQIIGLVLAGGTSSRLGQDKVVLRYHNQTLLERAVRVLGTCCSRVVISCRDPHIVPPHLEIVVDETGRIGPLGGIITALRQLGGPLLALACDLPLMDQSFLRKLITARARRPDSCLMTTWQERGSDRLQPLVAIYEPEALPLLEASMKAGKFKLHQIIPATRRQVLLYGPEERQIFFNINYPRDLEKLRALQVHQA